MYVTVSGSGEYRVIQFVEQHRIPNTKKKKTKVIETVGNYEKMLAEDPDIMEKLRAEAKKRTQEKKNAKQPVQVEIKKEPLNDISLSHTSYHIGHSVILQMWKDLAIDTFFAKHLAKRYPRKVQEAIFSLVLHRMLVPQSIRATHRDLPFYAGVRCHHKDLYYQVLDVLDELSDDLMNHLCKQFEQKTERSGPVAYYDVTTFSFESVQAGELRMFGYSKDHKNNEVQVVMGLLMDNQGIPISYQLFPGNTMDQRTLKDAVSELKQRYNMDKIVIVADRGLNSKDNLAMLVEKGHDFVISYSLKKAPAYIKEVALNEGDWQTVKAEDQGEVYYRSKVIEHLLDVKVELTEEERKALPKRPGRPRKYKTIQIPVHIHVTWEAKRAAKDRKDREKSVEKAQEAVDQPSKLKSSVKRGRNQYIHFDVDTEGIELDEAKIQEQSMYDGYYAIITNQLDLTTAEVTGTYGGLWQIEESFRVLKTDLRSQPVFVWTDAHIRGHFVLCFLSLCLMRYLQYRVKKSTGLSISCDALSQSMDEAIVTALGNYPDIQLVPSNISQTYLTIQKAMKMPELLTIMTRSEFKKITQLDLNKNYNL